MRSLSAFKNSVGLYFACTLGWSWLFWLPMVFLGFDQASLLGVTFFILGGLGPALATLFLLFTANDREARSAFWASVIDPRRIAPVWGLVTLLTVPLAGLLALMTARALGNMQSWEPAQVLGGNPLMLIPFLLSTLLFGPLPEEIGWRGYALPRLQRCFSSLVASLLLGLVWITWHLPLFFMKNSAFAATYGIGSSGFWAWALGLVAVSILMTWIFNATRSSTLSAILFHLVLNSVSGLLNLPFQAQIWMLVWLIAMALLVVVFGGRRLGGSRDTGPGE